MRTVNVEIPRTGDWAVPLTGEPEMLVDKVDAEKGLVWFLMGSSDAGDDIIGPYPLSNYKFERDEV